MMSVLPCALLALALALVAALSIAVIRARRRQEPRERHTTRQAICALLNPSNATVHDLLASRANPNQRLIRAFALTNTFVSSCPAVHSDFRNAAADLIRDASKDWPRFIEIARAAVHESLNPTSSPFTSVPFDRLAQAVTLRTILVGLLHVDLDMDQLAASDIDACAHLINKLWTASKSSNADALDPSELVHLNASLRRLMPDVVRYPNPLDFVIPAWETMWRVVAATVGHIALMPTDEQRCARALMQGVLERQEFTLQCPIGRYSALDCVNEVLRLHSPSKRISRDTSMLGVRCSYFQFPQALQSLLSFLTCSGRSTPRTTETADVQAYHLDENVWGPDVLAFNPARRATNGNLNSSLAFGYQPLACVASRWAPMAASVIAASLLEAFDNAKVCLKVGECVGEREGWSGWNVQKIPENSARQCCRLQVLR